MVTYLAYTAGELQASTQDRNLAYMACHFSLYTSGLSNLPEVLPPGSMLILNDQIPISGHDSHRIADQLQETIESFSCDSLLLDFQRPGNEETAQLCRLLAAQMPCPLGISHHYASSIDCAVFLPPPPLDMPLSEHWKPWQDRKIWLECALEAAEFTITPDGCRVSPLPYVFSQEETFIEESIHCRYRCEVSNNQVRFHLYRTADQLDALLEEADHLGIEKAVGLYQQLGKRKPLVE
jgi:hypothetical protein